MTLDEGILAEAKTAREAVLELERQQEHATVDYHHQIRRLHAAGGSLREIADALGLSHQRVHQIVGKDPLIPMQFPLGGHDVVREVRQRRGRKRPHGFFTAISEEGRRVVVLAEEEVRSLNHDYVGTEHILLGLLRVERSIAQRALEALGIGYERVREEVVRQLGECASPPPSQIPFTRAAKRSLELALREALRAERKSIRSEHVLLGLVDAKNSKAAEILERLGAPREAVRGAVESLLVE